MLEVKDLYVDCEGSEILKGFSLTVKPGEVHAIMGPNGAGKSTLAKVLAGDASYSLTSGSISLYNSDITELDPEERSTKGIFVGFQYPVEIPGISNKQFLLAAYNAHRKAQDLSPVSEEGFEKLLGEKLELLGMREAFAHRGVNEGFSGGEKKRNEILQMAVLDPKLMLLDETDSGLDIDAMRIVAKGIEKLMNKDKGLILITHYRRLLDYIKPDWVHVMVDGKIIESGDSSLADKLEKEGYDWVEA